MQEEVLKSPEIIQAFENIDRADFVPQARRSEAYINEPLPIGWGQTISQPYTVAFMLELLQPQKGQKILDIGSGSGWQTALLAQIVGENGRVAGLEVIPELHKQSIKNISKYNFLKKGIVEMHCLNAAGGFPKYAPYDRIIAAAAAAEIPQAWKDQLKIGGRLVAPVGSDVVLLIKKSITEFGVVHHPGFAFVPFV